MKPSTRILFDIPGLELVGLANMRGTWRIARAKKIQRRLVANASLAVALPLRLVAQVLEAGGRAHVTLERQWGHAKRAFDEGDNLPGAFKAIRDEIAAQLGVDDKTDRVEWECKQAASEKFFLGKRVPRVVITIEAREA